MLVKISYILETLSLSLSSCIGFLFQPQFILDRESLMKSSLMLDVDYEIVNNWITCSYVLP